MSLRRLSLRRLPAVFALAALFALSSSCSPKATPDTTVAAVCPPAATAPAAVNTLAELTAAAERSGTIRVIARLASAPSGVQPAMANLQSVAMAAFNDAGVAHAESLGDNLPFVVAELTAEQLNALYANPTFDGWEEDRIAKANLADSGPLVQAPQLWNLGGRGAGQAVAILDTGVDSTHPFLSGRVVAEACFSTTSAANGSTSVCPNGQASQIAAGAARPCGASGCEHGTHVAGIAAGRGPTFSGMAPDADIVAVQVFSRFTGAACGGVGDCVASFTSDQIRALDYVMQLAKSRPVASVNMSLGGGRSTGFCDTDLTKPVIDQLRTAGVAVAIASGNEGYRDSVSYPGCISSAVTVGATSKQDQVASFSNCGPQVDLHAPGVSINSSVPGGGFASFSGTSMATPHVAGAFAALRSYRPAATVDQIEQALKSTGLDVGGRPRIRLFDAANALAQMVPGGDAMVAEAASEGAPEGLAAIASLPEGQKVRLIVQIRQPAPNVAMPAAIDTVETAARAAGVTKIERMGSQPMIVVEATPAQARQLARSSAVAGFQLDQTATTQH